MVKKRNPVVISVRFTGKSLSMYEEILSMQEECGVSCNEIIRSLMLIGLQAYKKGAVAGFDGKVILPEDSGEDLSTAAAPVSTTVACEESSNLPNPGKTSSFLD